MPQDPTGSGSSSSSSSSDLAESDGRNDDDDEDAAATGTDNDDEHQLSQLNMVKSMGHDEDMYETVASDERSIEFMVASRETPCDSRSVPKVNYRRRYDNFQGPEYSETALTEPVNGNHDCSSSSANSLDDLCRGHQMMLQDFNRDTANSHDHYMVPTRDPRELNDRILSLFNPQFLPNFNDMIMYVASQCDARRSPPPRSRSMADGEDRFFRSSSYRKKRAAASSMFFRRGLTYEARK